MAQTGTAGKQVALTRAVWDLFIQLNQQVLNGVGGVIPMIDIASLETLMRSVLPDWNYISAFETFSYKTAFILNYTFVKVLLGIPL